MDKQKILDRISLLEAEKETHKANFSACEGAIQDCKYWLQQMESEEN